MAGPLKSLTLILTIAAAALGFNYCVNNSDNRFDSPTSILEKNGYVGEAQCVSCHKKEYDLWKGSHHDWAMKIATDETVLGNFNNQKLTLDGVDYHFFRDGASFMVRVKEINGKTETYKIHHTFGVTPLQQYITAFEKGKDQVLRVSWDSEQNKWFHQYDGQQFHPDDWLHWSEGGQRWNTMCAECHSTDLKRNYFVEEDSFHTTWSSINVSCEGCHGPGQGHLEWADDFNKKKGKKDTLTYILTGRDQKTQIDQCAPCHSRRVKLTGEFQQGEGFEDQFILQTIVPEYYHPDGQIEAEDYVIGSFLQSKMFLNGVKCNDCHDAHSMQLKLTGNDLCLTCHEPAEFDSKEHHFHDVNAEGGQCINCHMTGKTYMGNDFRRDHSFRIPRPDQSVAYGTPNACTGCHTDKSDEWAAENIVNWYGDNRPEHFSDALLLTTKYEITEEEQDQIRAFILNSKKPFLTRATAIENYSFTYSPKDLETLVIALDDSAALVRYKALMKFMEAPAESRHEIGMKYLTDPSRMVRIAAAQLTTDIDTVKLLPVQRNEYNAAIEEYEIMLFGNADFPLGRLHLGDYYFSKSQIQNAIDQYLIALDMDSLLTLVYPNLATTYSLAGKNDESMATLNALIELEPEYGRAYFLRALLHYELKAENAAIADFQEAIKFDPYDFRSCYNLATLYYQRKEMGKAESTIKKGLVISPESGEARYLLALIYRETGRENKATVILNELNAAQ